MAKFPALPLWTDSYVADCAHLNFTEHGAYLSLLVLMWRSPECRIPNDDAWIMRKMRCDANAMQTLMRPLMHEFCETDADWVWQPRLLKEWKWCNEKRKKNSEAAKSKWEKEKPLSERIPNAPANGDANGMPPSHTLSIPPISSLRSDTRALERSARRGETDGFEAFYLAYPRRIARRAAEKAYRAALKRASVSDIHEGARRYAASVGAEKENFIAHPATWLNADRWLDNLPDAPKPAAPIPDHLRDAWNCAGKPFVDAIGDAQFLSWFGDAEIEYQFEGPPKITVPSVMKRDYIQTKFIKQLRECFGDIEVLVK